jgi:hypothetical protein
MRDTYLSSIIIKVILLICFNLLRFELCKISCIAVHTYFSYDPLQSKIALLFKHRTQAAEMLAKKLQSLNEKWGNSLIVCAIPRGGVVTGEVIADALDVCLTRKES